MNRNWRCSHLVVCKEHCQNEARGRTDERYLGIQAAIRLLVFRLENTKVQKIRDGRLLLRDIKTYATVCTRPSTFALAK